VEEDRPASIGGGSGGTASTMASIEFRGIEKSFGPVTVLHGIELAIADGEFVVLVGPSGCGKSTLLRLLAGLDHADSGSIMIGGADVSDKAVTLLSLPSLLLFFFLQKYFIQGIASSGVKG